MVFNPFGIWIKSSGSNRFIAFSCEINPEGIWNKVEMPD
ncbi:hypothetical protein C943_02043 [Mariniradius saccharolyticus AK6]|uniref:Uncharacterized protein n=1 Tax=Mariniradius saccharolyticus AK6 TaxID=1239962 RepID=M7XTF8_9BACT|nr:hypothetical protein C943_02043 [Mariniradius saccharolyticus AK6]